MDRKEPTIPFLSFNKALEALDCSRSYLYKLVSNGALKPKYIGKKTYFMVEDLISVLKEESTLKKSK